MHEIKLPQLGQSVEEASIIEWRKKEGEEVSKGEIIFTVQTDKAEIECESTADGILRKILVEPDIEVPVMTVVALAGTADEKLPDLSQYALETEDAEEEAAPETAEVEAAPTVEATVAAPDAPQADAGVSPRARKKAERLSVNPSFISGTGPGGRVTESDVDAYADSFKATPTALKIALDDGVDIARVESTDPDGRITKEDIEKSKSVPKPATTKPGETKRVPLTRMRKIIAKRMCDSLFSAPHYAITIEVDMANATAFRSNCDYRPSFNDMVLYATAQALQKHPDLNARWLGDAIEIVGDINLGFAVAVPSGLLVPVVRQL